MLYINDTRYLVSSRRASQNKMYSNAIQIDIDLTNMGTFSNSCGCMRKFWFVRLSLDSFSFNISSLALSKRCSEGY